MGFSSQWVAEMKRVAPSAFTAKAATPNLRGVFIDGQIQLMKGQHIHTMTQFYQAQFANVVNRYLDRDSRRDMTVVVAFDDYAHVPSCKSMTQSRRKQRVTQPLVFGEHDLLPTDKCPPNWEAAMANRTFKVKLIASVVEKMGELVKLRGKQRLIMDFWGKPVLYTLSALPEASATSAWQGQTDMRHVAGNTGCTCFAWRLEGVEQVGEADCKFPRWVSYVASLYPGEQVDVIVEATDSDYLAIAMLQYQRVSQRVLSPQVRAQKVKVNLGNVTIRRIRCNVAATEPGGSNRPHCKAEGKTEGKDEASGVSKAPSASSTTREMEYVHIPLLYECLKLEMQGILGGPNAWLQGLVCLIGLNGTDFSRPVPLVLAERMWKFVKQIHRDAKGQKTLLLTVPSGGRNGLLQGVPPLLKNAPAPRAAKGCEEPRSLCEEFDEDSILDQLMTQVYARAYPAHLKAWDGASFESMSALFKSDRCRLAEKTKEDFPSMEMLVTTVRNASWVLAYWTCAAAECVGDVPDPLQPRYGFALDSKDKPQWLDLAMQERAAAAAGQRKRLK
jgi:hypothetical protein